MFGFLKKLFGSKPAEQTAAAPYKVEVPVLTEVVEAPKGEAAPVVTEAPKAEPAPAPKKKPAGRKPAGQKPAKKQPAPKQAAPKQGGAKKGGRKPKSKPQA